MSGTQVRMVRTITTNTDPTKRYSIASTCIAAGTLTDTGIFLLAINDPNDPKDDTFTRLITVDDVNNFLNSRSAAVSAGATYWRSTSSTVYFADIEAANSGWKELSSRITTLVDNVDSYNAEFATGTGGVVITYPTVDEGAKNTLIAAYLATAAPLTAAEEARDSKILECKDVETDITNTQERLVEAEADLAAYQPLFTQSTLLNGNLATIRSTLTTNNTTVRAANAVTDATDAQKDSIEATLVSNDAQLTLLNTESTSATSLNTAIGGIVGTLQTRVNTLRSALTTLQTQYAVCAQEMAALQAAVTQATADREEALAAVRVACPDYTSVS